MLIVVSSVGNLEGVFILGGMGSISMAEGANVKRYR